jgi:hypothetical protein
LAIVLEEREFIINILPFPENCVTFCQIFAQKFMDAAWCKAPQVSSGNHRRKVKNKGGHVGE